MSATKRIALNKINKKSIDEITELATLTSIPKSEPTVKMPDAAILLNIDVMPLNSAKARTGEKSK